MDEVKFHLHQIFLANVIDPSRTDQEAMLTSLADLTTDFGKGDFKCTDRRAYAATYKLNDLNTPYFTDAMSCEHANEYVAAMKKKIKQLVGQ